MSPVDYVYREVYLGALQSGAAESQAKNHAVMALDDFKKKQVQTTAQRARNRA